MSRKPPSSKGMMEQMMMQQMVSNQKLAMEQAAFTAELDQRRRQAEDAVRAQEAALKAGIQGSIAKPLNLGTLLTGSSGLLGNPMLSLTKLSG